MEDMEYFTQRLQCSDEEKDACLETVVKLYHLCWYLRKNGFLAAADLAEKEEDAFFRAGLLDLADICDPEEMERVFTQYLMAGDYRGSAFLNAVLISKGLVLIVRREGQGGEEFREKSWGENWVDHLWVTLRGYFGVEYREKVTAVLQQAHRERRAQRECFSLLREFDKLTGLTLPQRDWLIRHVSSRTLCYAMKLGGSAVSRFLMEGAEDREALERDFAATTNVREMDVEAAQREILEKAEEAKKCM